MIRHRARLAAAFYALLLVAGFLVVSAEPALLATWAFLSPRVSSTVALYDGDSDGEVDQVAVDGYVVLPGGVEIPTKALPFKGDVTGRGELCLLLYTPLTGGLSATCPSGTRVYAVPANATLRVYRHGVIVGEAVLTQDTTYYSEAATSGAVVLVENKPAVFGVKNGYLALHDLETGFSEYIQPLVVTVVAALYNRDTKTVYAIAVTDTETLYMEYEVVTRRLGYRALGIGRTMQAVSTGNSIFVLTERGTVYQVVAGGSLRYVTSGKRLFYPAGDLDSFTVLGASEVIMVKDTGATVLVDKLELPATWEVHAADWYGGIVGVATSGGVYLAIAEPLAVYIKAPISAYAGDPVEFEVSGNYSHVSLKVLDKVYTSLGGLRVTTTLPAGNVVVLIEACRGVYCVKERKGVLVLRRPLELFVNYSNPVKPYGELSLNAVTVDTLTGREVEVNCTLRDPHGRLQVEFASGVNVTAEALPDVDSVVYTLACGGGDYVEVVTTVRSKLSEPYLDVKLVYRGGGVMEISGYDKYTGEKWQEDVVVELNGEVFVGIGEVVVTVPPGKATLRVKLVKDGVVYHEKGVRVVYYEDVSLAPPAGEVTVADRVVVTTTTVTETRAVHVPVVVKETDPLLLAVTAAVSAIAVYAVLMLLGRTPSGKIEV